MWKSDATVTKKKELKKCNILADAPIFWHMACLVIAYLGSEDSQTGKESFVDLVMDTINSYYILRDIDLPTSICIQLYWDHDQSSTHKKIVYTKFKLRFLKSFIQSYICKFDSWTMMSKRLRGHISPPSR